MKSFLVAILCLSSLPFAAAAQKLAISPSDQLPKPQSPASELIEQGKALYRAAKFKQALAKFEAVFKIEPNHDEALGLAAITAFRLDNQQQARQWFLQRAELADQKDSVKAFSYYRIALTYWRQAHDIVAKHCLIKDKKVECKISDADKPGVHAMLSDGLAYVDRALQLNANYAEAYNVENLLHAEAVLAADNEGLAQRERTLALNSLRNAIRLQSTNSGITASEHANFNSPTVRIGEIARTKEEEALFENPMLKLTEGGRPIKRVSPVFPSTSPAPSKNASKDSLTTGATDKGGAYSIGSGRSALTAAYAPGIVKVEVLISTKGEVVFTHVIDGRADLNGAAILAARAWKFAPATFEGTPVQLSGVITFEMKPAGKQTTKQP